MARACEHGAKARQEGGAAAGLQARGQGRGGGGGIARNLEPHHHQETVHPGACPS